MKKNILIIGSLMLVLPLAYLGLRKIPFSVKGTVYSIASLSDSFIHSSNLMLGSKKQKKDFAEKFNILKPHKFRLKTEDNLNLESYLIEPRIKNNKAIILLHGNGNPKEFMFKYAKLFSENKYTVLSFDFRGQGNSEGNVVSYGVKEQIDLNSAINFLKSNGYDRIGVLGVSLGGATAMINASKNKSIDALVVDGAYSNLDKTTLYQFRNQGIHVNSFFEKIIIDVVKFDSFLKTGINYFSANPEDYAKDIQQPILIIHGDKDMQVSLDEAINNFSQIKSNNKKDFWLIKNYGHCSYIWYNITGYENKILDFFNRSL